MILQQVNKIPWVIIIALCATLGLAPFSPPHLVEKLVMLANGELTRGVDIFDLCLHATPWVLLIVKVIAVATTSKEKDTADY